METKNEKLVYEDTIELPEGVTVTYQDKELAVKGPEGEIKKPFDFPGVSIEPTDGSVKLITDNHGKRVKKLFSTARALLKNAVKGVVEPYTYELEICSSHFPMNVKLSGTTLTIKNLFGEAYPRVLEIKGGANVQVQEKTITVASIDKSLAGQVAADIEQLTKIKNRDHRIFQDGIYITKKAK